MPVNPANSNRPRFVLLSYGFRPFFLLAGLWAIVPMLMLVCFVRFFEWPASAVPLLVWHGHEMIFGFTAAAIAGFLLTAVPSWTGTRAASGPALAALALLWLIGRLLTAPGWQPALPSVQALAMLFFPALAVTIALPLLQRRNYRNLPFLLFLTLLFVADLAFHGQRFGWIDVTPFDPLRLAVNTVLLVVVIVGGRIVPAFTRNAFAAMGRERGPRSFGPLDAAAITATAAVVAGDIVVPGSGIAGALAGLAAILLGIRATGWRSWRTGDVPLLWVLHVGYWWLIAGLALKSVWLLGGAAWSANWLHAITAGGFGTMILGVMTRAALGHTGRPLAAAKPIALAYALVSAAAALRLWGPWLLPGHYWGVLLASALVWSTAYAIYLVIYAPILLRPRVDGRPG